MDAQLSSCWPHYNVHDSKVHEANMGPVWVRQDPGGSHVDRLKLAIWGVDEPGKKY